MTPLEVKRLRDQRHLVWKQAKALAWRHLDNPPGYWDLTAYEQAVWDGLMDELDRLDRKLMFVTGGQSGHPDEHGWIPVASYSRT